MVDNMKLAGSKRKGRHLMKNAGAANPNRDKFVNGSAKAESGIKTDASAKPKKSGKRKLVTILIIILGVIVLFIVAAFIYLKWGVTPPVGRTAPRGSGGNSAGGQPGEIDPDNPVPPKTGTASGRDYTDIEKITGRYTFLILATDEAGGNTDTIMTATFDAETYTMEVVSIPRDTLVNVGWSVKKANSIYANMLYRNRNEQDKQVRESNAMQATIEMFADILGYECDFLVIVDLKAFIKLVDEVGGVDFYVPRNMDYDDPAQNLHIHFREGMQHLSGQQAMEVVRFRRTYANADIGRIGTQQDFLVAAAQQILEKKDSLNILSLAGIFKDYVKTEMSLNDIAWFAKQFLMMDAENIHFDTAPGNYNDSINGESYVTLYVDDWLELVNTKLNPWDMVITPEDVSIYTRGANKQLYVTDGSYVGSSSFGRGSSGSSSTNSGNSANSGNNSSGDSSDSGDSGSSADSGSSGNNASSGSNTSPPPSGTSTPPASTSTAPATSSPAQGSDPQDDSATETPTGQPTDAPPPVDDLDGPVDGPDDAPPTGSAAPPTGSAAPPPEDDAPSASPSASPDPAPPAADPPADEPSPSAQPPADPPPEDTPRG